MVAKYSRRIERSMLQVFLSLGERERRLYAAIEADKLGHGGIGYVAQLFDCDRKTVRRGLKELDQPSPLPPGRSRKKGAAGKPA